jgi:hypothetical protein
LSRVSLLSGLALACVLGCGGGQEGSSFDVQPEPRVVAVGDQLGLTASPNVDLAGDLEWEVEEPYGGGLRNTQGYSTVYYAPTGAGTFHLTLRGVRTDGKRVKQTLEIRVLPLATLEPSSVQVRPEGTVAFTATMKGLGHSSVTWKVEEPGGGECSDDGRYQAPSRPGTYHVDAISTLDPTVIARATVVVD